MVDTTSYGFLKVSGLDAKKFLQGQLTCNMEEITSQQSHLGAHCNPQGRVISLFDLFLHEDDYYLLMPASMVSIALSALKKYIVFYKTTLEALPTSEAAFFVQPMAILEKIQAGVPSIYPETSGKFLPHELNLHLLHAISFNKGCYTGQEIIARMHYRGKLKKHLYQAKLITPTHPTPGSDVYYQLNNELKIGGTIIDYHSHHLLLVCEEEQAKNDRLFIEKPHRTYLIF